MSKFDWDKFKSGEIAVHCDTEEMAKDFLKECDNKKIKWSGGDKAKHHTNYGVYHEITCYHTRKGRLTYCDTEHFERTGIETIKWEVEEMKKTFREVIADIKPGEVWESDNKIVRCPFDGIQIYHKEKGRITNSMLMLDKDKFTLQRKEYTFEEAFKAYEEGKEIESVISEYRHKKIDNRDSYYSNLVEEWMNVSVDFSLDEIRGKWYIND